MSMLNVEVSVSCCSGLIEMVHNVSVLSIRIFLPFYLPIFQLVEINIKVTAQPMEISIP